MPDLITAPMCFVETYHFINNSFNLGIFLNHHFLIGCYYSLIWHPAVYINANYLFSDLAPQYLSDVMEHQLSYVSFQSTRWLFHHSWNLWMFLKVNNILHPWKWRKCGNDQWFTVWDFRLFIFTLLGVFYIFEIKKLTWDELPFCLTAVCLALAINYTYIQEWTSTKKSNRI